MSFSEWGWSGWFDVLLFLGFALYVVFNAIWSHAQAGPTIARCRWIKLNNRYTGVVTARGTRIALGVMGTVVLMDIVSWSLWNMPRGVPGSWGRWAFLTSLISPPLFGRTAVCEGGLLVHSHLHPWAKIGSAEWNDSGELVVRVTAPGSLVVTLQVAVEDRHAVDQAILTNVGSGASMVREAPGVLS